MDARKKRFAAALLLFATWIGVLGLLAISSSRRPMQRPAAAAPR
jgi:hypothetical protein